MKSLLKLLGERGVTSVLVEGGSKVFTSFLEEGLVDKFVFFICPKIMGAANKPVFSGKVISSMDDVLNVCFTPVDVVGKDIMVEAYPLSNLF